MVNAAFQPDFIPQKNTDKAEKLSTTVKLSEVLNAGVRFEASAFNIDAHNAIQILQSSPFPLIPLYGENGLSQEAHNAFRFRRVYVSSTYGIPFLSSSEIISLKPDTDRYLSKKNTKKLNSLKIQKWDVLVSRSGTIGNVGFATDSLKNKAVSEDVIRIRVKNPEAAGFLAAFLICKYGRLQLTQATYGSVIVHIELEHLRRILVPDLPVIRRIEIGRLMCEAGKLRDQANQLLNEADKLLHEKLNLPYLKEIIPTDKKSSVTKIKASQLAGRLEASYHNSTAIAAEQQLAKLPWEITTVGDSRVTKEVRAITKFRKRTYVEKGGIPLLSSKQLFQIAPIDVKRLAKGAHTKDLPEIQLEENMIAVTRSGTIGRVQIIPKYMENWTASEHATRFLASDQMNPGFLYAWLASDYGYALITRHSYGSVILEVDKEMFSSIQIPLVEPSIRNEIGDLVLKANQLRDDAWNKEQKAITKLENLISQKPRTMINNTNQSQSLAPPQDFSFDPNAESIWELAARLSAQVPESEWEKLPTDLARNFDTYQE
ncbi:restriction endonuclease subunit S [Picosynechococcus sp. PCC 73109]|uniref:restriction endonuclease subunit S n=1 Tax=Picosynechococcus sp. PCC 73109 TaxID=374982 RepID=UPI0007457D87|nr:restriction endonuclease subunit S [Picosynechococcus sp. PCC 73109]AMA08957.1 type I restriction endonuclease subunit R [Picosynechococcus sp. PCC 73109]